MTNDTDPPESEDTKPDHRTPLEGLIVDVQELRSAQCRTHELLGEVMAKLGHVQSLLESGASKWVDVSESIHRLTEDAEDRRDRIKALERAARPHDTLPAPGSNGHG